MASFSYAIIWLFGSVTNATTLCLFIITFLLVFFSTRRRPGIPPGPPLIPVVGNLLSLASADILGVFRKLRKSYGDVYGLYIGSELMISLNGYDVIHEALIKKGSVFSMRPETGAYKLVVKRFGIVMANGCVWKEQKRFAQNSFKEIMTRGNGKNIEELILNEASSIVTKLNEMQGPFVIDTYIKVATANVMTKLLFDHRFEFDDETFIKILSAMSENVKNFSKILIKMNCFPNLHRLPGDLLNSECLQEQGEFISAFVRTFIDDHKARYCDSKNDFIDLFIKRQMDNAEVNVSDSFTDSILETTCYDLLGGGTETTASTIRWLIIYLIRCPTIQEKMYSEINQIIGTTPPSLSHRASLVYVEAVILEGLRIACPLPLAAPHGIAKDIMFRNYLIPQNATVLVNLESALMDPNVWENPHEFRPERFLNEDATELSVPAEFIPFSIGLRSCLGESLSRMELFLFMTSLVQAYEFRSADDSLPSVHGDLGLTYTPKTFQIRIIKR